MKKSFFSSITNNILLIFLISIILLSLVFLYIKLNSNQNTKESIENQNQNQTQTKSVELVISRYNEDLEWLKTEPFNKFPCSITIYNKGPNDNFYKPENTKNIIKLPNVGRESHTYLHHVINNYDNLSDIVVFLPGSVDMENKRSISTRLLNEIKNQKSAVFLNAKSDHHIRHNIYNFSIDYYRSTYQNNSEINPENKLVEAPERPFGKWLKSRFGDVKVDVVTDMGIFSIAKEDILQHPKSYYENLIKELETSSNPEVGHYFERAWSAVFGPFNQTKVL